MARDCRGVEVTINPAARIHIRHGGEDRRIIPLRLDKTSRNHRNKVRIRLVHIRRRAARRHRRRPVAARVRHDRLVHAKGVGNDYIHIRDIRLACVLGAIAICVHIQMTIDRRGVEIAVVASTRAHSRNRSHGRRISAFSFDKTSRNHSDEIRIRLVHIRRRAARRHRRRPVAARIRHDRLVHTEGIRNDNIDVRNVWLARVLRAVAIRIHIQMTCHRGGDEVTVRAAVRAHIGHRSHRRRIRALGLHCAYWKLRISLAHIRRRAARRDGRRPIAARVRHNRLRRTKGVRDDHVHIRKIRLASVLHAIAIRINVEMACHRRRDEIAVRSAICAHACHRRHSRRVSAFRLNCSHWELRIGLTHIRRRAARRHASSPVAARIRHNSLIHT